MSVLDVMPPTERVSALVVVCLPEDGLITGFEAGKWTVIERLDQEGEAKLHLQRLLPALAALRARAFVIRESDPRDRNKMVSWRTMVRYNEPEVYLDPSDAVDASPDALRHWQEATTQLQSRPAAPAKPARSLREPLIMGASVVAAVAALVATLAMAVALQAPKIGLQDDALLEFARQGGITLSLPDESRQGWYMRVKIHPNKLVEIVDRFPASRLQSRASASDARLEDVLAAFKEGNAFSGTEDGKPSVLGPKLEAISSAFKRK